MQYFAHLQLLGVAMRLDNIMFDITDHCNFTCKHCYKSQPGNYTDLNTDIIISFIKEVKNRGNYPPIVISGGEPLLYNNLFQLLDYICDGRKVRINTNGVLLDKYYEKLTKYQNLVMQVSLDGYDDETFFEVRNNHLFQKIVDNSIEAHKAGLGLYFRATLTSKTINDYQRFISLSKMTDIPLVIRPMYNTGEPEQQELKVEYAELCDWLEKAIADGYLEYLGGRNLISESSCPLLNEKLIYSTLTVDNQGNVYPCQLLRSSQFHMGNIYSDSYDDIFSKGNIIVSNIQKIINSKSCKQCGFRSHFGDGTCLSACYIGNKRCVKYKIAGSEI